MMCDNSMENTSIGVGVLLIGLAAVCCVRARLPAPISQHPERMLDLIFLTTLASTQRVELIIGVCYARTFLFTPQP